MSRPDLDPILKGMGAGEPTCDLCLTRLYPNLPDSVCEDCTLNPLKAGPAESKEFIEKSLKRAFGSK